MSDERTPLLWSSSYQDRPTTNEDAFSHDPHTQFCYLVGIPSSEPVVDGKPHPTIHTSSKSLYSRATYNLASQRFSYYFTASLFNTMLLSQVILGAALTGLGASESSHILITVFGALNTVIAGLIAYLKSRGQPMRAKMYRDDLERVVDEIENSEVMWLGISRHVHGYEDIDTGDSSNGKDGERNSNAVTVRSEVARLTRLYEKAILSHKTNDPDLYMTGTIDATNGQATLRTKAAVGGQAAPLPGAVPAPAINANPAPAAPVAAPVEQTPDPDESPATAPPKPKEEPKVLEKPKEESKAAGDAKGKAKVEDEEESSSKENPPDATTPSASGSSSAPAAGSSADATPADPDAEPASDTRVPLKKVAGDATDGES